MAADNRRDTPGTLNGWKEIAAHLGRSPRSVQRWERDLGLPVRRIPTPDGGVIIFALIAELEAWRHAQSAMFEAQDKPDSGQSASPMRSAVASETAPQSEGPAPTPRRWWQVPVPLWIAMAAALVTATLALATGALISRPAGGRPATWEFDGHRMTTHSAGGRRLWSHDFEKTVSTPITFNRGNGFVGDANGDRAPDLLVPVRYTSSHLLTTSESDAVVAFDAEGRVLWSVQPDIQLTAGDETFGGPWNVYDIVSGESPRGPRVWIAFSHQTWWPGFIMEVTPAGEATVILLHAARIQSLTHWIRQDAHILVAGGDLRDTHGPQAGAILVDLAAPPARWPGEGPTALACAGCPTGRPASVLLFPTSEVTRALFRPSGWVTRGKVTETGLQLDVNDGLVSARWSPSRPTLRSPHTSEPTATGMCTGNWRSRASSAIRCRTALIS